MFKGKLEFKCFSNPASTQQAGFLVSISWLAMMYKPEVKHKEPVWKTFGVVNSSSLKMITCHTQVKFYASNVHQYRSRAKYEKTWQQVARWDFLLKEDVQRKVQRKHACLQVYF